MVGRPTGWGMPRTAGITAVCSALAGLLPFGPATGDLPFLTPQETGFAVSAQPRPADPCITVDASLGSTADGGRYAGSWLLGDRHLTVRGLEGTAAAAREEAPQPARLTGMTRNGSRLWIGTTHGLYVMAETRLAFLERVRLLWGAPSDRAPGVLVTSASEYCVDVACDDAGVGWAALPYSVAAFVKAKDEAAGPLWYCTGVPFGDRGRAALAPHPGGGVWVYAPYDPDASKSLLHLRSEQPPHSWPSSPRIRAHGRAPGRRRPGGGPDARGRRPRRYSG
jgi:hypothetical protein